MKWTLRPIHGALSLAVRALLTTGVCMLLGSCGGFMGPVAKPVSKMEQQVVCGESLCRGYSHAVKRGSSRTSIPSKTIAKTSINNDVFYGVASYYREGPSMAKKTASGEPLRDNELTAAHPKLPFGTMLRVTNLKNGKTVVVKVNDRGPFSKRRVIDLSFAAARHLNMVGTGVANVKVELES